MGGGTREPSRGSLAWGGAEPALLPACRLFVVHGDGTAAELLSSPRVEELLRQARSHPDTALLKEPLPDCPGRRPEPIQKPPRTLPEPIQKPHRTAVSPPGEFGITILKPGHRSLWSRWILGKQAPDITPQNLRNRDWVHFPQVEVSGAPVQARFPSSWALTSALRSSRRKLLVFSSGPTLGERRPAVPDSSAGLSGAAPTLWSCGSCTSIGRSAARWRTPWMHV